MGETSATGAALRDRCVASLRHLSRALHEDDEEWLSLDLTMGQFKAMMALGLKGPLAIGDLGRRIGISEPAASLLVDQLVRRGYVGRATDPADRRRVLLAATSRGTKLLGELRHGSEQSLQEWLADVGDDDLDVLARGLRALTEVTGAIEPPAAGDATAENRET